MMGTVQMSPRIVPKNFKFWKQVRIYIARIMFRYTLYKKHMEDVDR